MTPTTAPGMRDVARAAGVSVATVSRALRGGNYLKPETRQAVLRAAQELGYTFNPHVGHLMSALRGKTGGSFAGSLALLWYDTSGAEQHPWRREIQKNTLERAAELGYAVSEFERMKYPPERLTRIMLSRGVDAVIITPPEKASGKVHMSLRFEQMACVSMGWALYSPAFHCVKFDHFQALRLAVHYARRKYGESIAALLDLRYDRRADGSCRGGFLAHHPAGPHKAKKLIFDLNRLNIRKLREAFEKKAFRCLIAQARIQLPAELFSWFPEEDILFLDEPVRTGAYGFIDYRHDLLARWAVDLAVAAVQRREKGVPAMPMMVHVPPCWVPGAAI